MRGSLLNPIRFYDSSGIPDYSTIFPNFDNIPYGNNYFYGVNASSDVIRKHVGTMYLQFLNQDNAVVTFFVYKRNDEGTFIQVDTIDSVEISPVGWVGYQIHKLTVSLSDGIYYLIDTNGYKSDVFIITSSVSQAKTLVKIKYSHLVNEWGCIFGTNYFEAYFRGKLTAGQDKIDIDAMDSDRGYPIKLKSTPNRTIQLSLMGISSYYKDLVNTIFCCNQLTINGVDYENMESPKWNIQDGGDIGIMTIDLIQKTNDYYYG